MGIDKNESQISMLNLKAVGNNQEMQKTEEDISSQSILTSSEK